MKQSFQIALVLAGCLIAAPRFHAQTPAQNDTSGAGQNKADENSQKSQAKQGDGQKQSGSQPQSNANPFPTDTSAVPVMPSNPSALAGGIPGMDGNAPIPLPAGDPDPARSPDDGGLAGSSTSQGYSSSSTGDLPPLPDTEPKRRKKGQDDVLAPPPRETAKDDVNVGTFYLQTGNWAGALSRFQSALVLDPQNPEVFWGLAECERHLGDYVAARNYYLKVIEYDPGTHRSKDARNALQRPEIANAQGPAQGQTPAK
ncbi:MAG: tetratricopeptide repeat protein [Acidobacteriota bacterium]|jgi:tetratricopeptide (TPR) repeat protein